MKTKVLLNNISITEETREYFDMNWNESTTQPGAGGSHL
jgi:hypothetical protein